jgi:hypothetical protein
MPSEPVFPIQADIGLNRSRFDVEGTRRLKRFLISTGYLREENSSPEFDDNTADALRIYQQRYNLAATGVFDEATYRKTRTKRCGLRDNVPEWMGRNDVKLQVYEIHGNPYGQTQITYRIANYPQALDSYRVSEAIELAFKCWEEALAPDYHFMRVEDNANIEIGFFVEGEHRSGDALQFREAYEDGPTILAHAFYPVDEARALDLDGQIHFSDFIDWSVDGSSDVDLMTIALHEIGHALGLGHSDSCDLVSIMQPEYTGPQTGLAAIDIENIRRIYIQNETAQFFTIVGEQGGGPPSSRAIRFDIPRSSCAE